MEQTKKINNEKWPDLINKSVHTSDDIDIGDIYAVNKDFVVVKRGYINIHYYYIPIFNVEGWDGKVVWLKVNEEKVNSKYQRNELIPNPSRYYIKDHPIYNSSSLSEVKTIPSKMAEPAYSFEIPVTTTLNNDANDDTNRSEQTLSINNGKFKCDLCDKSNFNSEEELSNHIKSNH
ncbi:MAG: C2H2-type zinc finger protein [Candidatus Nitrosocosmicus sp.]